MVFVFRLLLTLALALAMSGCSSLYYSSMKKLGKEKRDILVSRIVAGKEAQEEASKQVKTAYEAFKELTNFKGGDLEKVQKSLAKEFGDVEDRANNVSDRIASIDKVGQDLFHEWGTEIEQMSDNQLKSDSRKLLRETRDRHQKLMKQMKSSESKLKPVVQAFRDQVLYLKHNLNARAINSLKKTVIEIDDDIAALIKDIEASNQEADRTIAGLQADS
jgi:gas vesicle protein